jgi:hypothetical protein
MSRLGHEVKVEMSEENEFQRKCRRVDNSSVGFGLLFVRPGDRLNIKRWLRLNIFLKCAAARTNAAASTIEVMVECSFFCYRSVTVLKY